MVNAVDPDGKWSYRVGGISAIASRGLWATGSSSLGYQISEDIRIPAMMER